MLDQDKPLHARADKMLSKNNNLYIRYEGNAVLWQGADRVEAEVVEIDRDNDALKAHGHVLSQLQDKVKDADTPTDGKSAGKPDGKTNAKADSAPKDATKARLHVFTVVRAPELDYNDETRLAHYSGGVTLERDNMVVKSQDVHAYLRNNSNDSSLDHAIADGHVEVHQLASDRTRDASSEHAEYYVDEDKVILEGGDPRFVDSAKGTTRSSKLIWYSKQNRLDENGSAQEPVKSLLHKKTVSK
jgi:lipopolysaccharide export system protein LptA